MDMERVGFTLDEAARYIGVSHWAVRRAINRGELASFRIGRRILVPAGEMERLVHPAPRPSESRSGELAVTR